MPAVSPSLAAICSRTVARQVPAIESDAGSLNGDAMCSRSSTLIGGAVSIGNGRSTSACAGAPVAVGFGIRTPVDAARFAAIADGVVVGSALVDQVAMGDAAGAPARVAALVTELARAMAKPV